MRFRRQLATLALLVALPAMTDFAAAEPCAEPFTRQPASSRLACLGDDTAITDQQALRWLQSADGRMDHRVVAALLDRIRLRAADTALPADDVASLLRHEHPLYRDRDRWEVVRLRAHVITTLSAIGFPASAMPLLEDSLMFVDERLAPVELGSAVRAAAGLGPRARRFLPGMMQVVGERFADEEFSLERYGVDFPPEEATTVQIELLRAAGFIALPGDADTLATLDAITRAPLANSLDPRAVTAAREALERIERRADDGIDHQLLQAAAEGSYPRWSPLAPGDLETIAAARMADHDGRELRFGELMDRPLVLCFFYTRCQNAGKCSTSISRLAFLQRALREAGLDRDARLVAVTLEPAFDTPDRLRRFVQDRGLALSHYAVGGRILEADHEDFVAALGVPVGYSAGWVNTHGVLAVLIDAKALVLRRYLSGDWAAGQVAEDIVALNRAP